MSSGPVVHLLRTELRLTQRDDCSRPQADLARCAVIDSISGKIEPKGTHSAGAIALSESTPISLSHVRASDGQFASGVFDTRRPKAWPPRG